jgi:hypothetical protein
MAVAETITPPGSNKHEGLPVIRWVNRMTGDPVPHPDVTGMTFAPLKEDVEAPDNLVVRLDLNFVQYGQMERLLQLGIDHLNARKKALYDLHEAVRAGTADIQPMNDEDARMAHQRATDDFRAAERLLSLVSAVNRRG